MDEPWIDIYLRALASHGLLAKAATTAGVTRLKVQRLRETSAEFDYQVESALEAAADVLEEEARRRAVDGIEKGVYYQGVHMNTEIQYSDALLTTLLKAKRADEFAERKQITGAGGKPLTVVIRSFGTPAAPQEQASADPDIIDAHFLALPAPAAIELADVLDMV